MPGLLFAMMLKHIRIDLRVEDFIATLPMKALQRENVCVKRECETEREKGYVEWLTGNSSFLCPACAHSNKYGDPSLNSLLVLQPLSILSIFSILCMKIRSLNFKSVFFSLINTFF